MRNDEPAACSARQFQMANGTTTASEITNSQSESHAPSRPFSAKERAGSQNRPQPAPDRSTKALASKWR